MKTDIDKSLDRLVTTALILFLIGLGLFLTGCYTVRNGVDGRNGTVAESPVLSASQADLTECPTGGLEVWSATGTITSLIGSVCNGVQGPVGVPGVDGTDGSDGTQIEFIQFCAGTPVYPSVFPEVGLRIGTNVWGVYSANGGFLAYLPPGRYSSSGIGNSCTFSINSDGTVSP